MDQEGKKPIAQGDKTLHNETIFLTIAPQR